MVELDHRVVWPIRSREVLGTGSVSSFVEETVETPNGEVMKRQFVTHPGAVAIVAWNEDDDTVAVVNQYRHPVRMELVEVPAGLLDVNGEDYQAAAARELAEEAELAAARWNVLTDIFTTPGGNEETLRIFLARDLSAVERPAGFQLEDEEAVMTSCFVPRDDLVKYVFEGRVQSPTLVGGVLALEVARLRGDLDKLRPANAPWLARDR
ncbi:NUDIX hydrolase [Actinomycetaceae bacterium MB13-C1-2]|nr:NUDIX hydrolase [Actinomycetaceae bacterium MB13-C1-2]